MSGQQRAIDISFCRQSLDAPYLLRDRTAEEQLELAKKLKLTHLWITDHDMIRDLSRVGTLKDKARALGLQVGFGVEITVLWLKKEHHLLGYFPDSAWDGPTLSKPMKELQTACAVVKSSRENRNNGLVAYLNELLASPDGAVYFTSPDAAQSFQPITVAAVASWAKENANLLEPSSLGRPHFSKFLAKQRGIRMDLIFGPRSGDGMAIVTADNAYYGDDKAGKSGDERAALMHSATLAKQ